MKVRIKFCGGCDPEYDRVQVYQSIKNLAGDSIEWLANDEQDEVPVLMVCGCPRACPQHNLRDVSRLVSITNNGLCPQRVVAQLLGRGWTDEH